MKKLSILILPIFLCSCAHPNQNNYGEGEVGHDTVIMYGIVKSVRQVDITGHNSGTGAALGAVGGGVAGSAIGRGNGSLAGLLVGAVVGGVAGAVAEQAIKDRQGIEYVIKFSETGASRSILQNIAKTDTPIAKGQCVMVQMNGQYQRVLPDDDASDCPKPVKHKVTKERTILTPNHGSATIMDSN